MSEKVQFPAFRKLANGRSYYRIDAPDNMIEWQLMGERYMVHTHVARIMPERWLIKDVLELAVGRWEEISAEEFAAFEQECIHRRTRVG